MPEISKENAGKSQKIIKFSQKDNHLLVPGGYFCGEKMDDIAKCNADILRTLNQITNTANISKEDIYRLVAKIYDQVHTSNEALLILRMIYK
jgi:hypothetical protein